MDGLGVCFVDSGLLERLSLLNLKGRNFVVDACPNRFHSGFNNSPFLGSDTSNKEAPR